MSDTIASRVAAAVPLRLTGACAAVRGMSEPRPLRDWRALGVTLRNGSLLPASDLQASLVRIDARSFLVYGNYEALLAYNCAHTYALSIGILSDRIGNR